MTAHIQTIETRTIDHDGQRLALRVHPVPGRESPVGSARVAVLLPAMGVPAAYYDGFAALLTGTGLHVVVADLRGTGDSTPIATRASRYGYAELVDDVDVVLRHVGAEAPLLIGHSLGGHAAALHLARGGTGAGLVLIASGTPYRRFYTGRFGAGLRLLAPAVAGVSAVLGYWPGHRLGFGGRQSRGVMRGWAHAVRTGRFPRLDGVDTEARLAEVKVPVLAVSVAGDRFTPSSTLDHFTAKLRHAEVTRHHYTSAESGAPMDHFRWTRAAGPLVSRIADFAATL